VSRVVDIDRGYAALMGQLRDMESTAVEAGVRGQKAAERPKQGGLTVAEYATVNEFGSGNGGASWHGPTGIPERSFMRSTFDKNAAKYSDRLDQAVLDVVDGKRDLATSLERIGLEFVGDVNQAIADVIPPPNAPETIARKGSSTPLIDSGRLRQSLDAGLVPPEDL
jgi:hypothetical protein